MEWVRPFADLAAGDLALAGGKGANLAELARAGLPVPPGFVVLTAAYRAFVDASGIGPELARLAVAGAEAALAGPDAALGLAAASDAIRGLFAGSAVPDGVARAVLAAYAALGGGPVAVRSSATAEDLPGASFAGQQETYLNVEGPAALLEAVRRCWSSLWTARAIAYRARQGIAPESVALAVVVQRLVEAEAAGVLFTADPVTGRRDRMAVDGAWGLGEAVVSGAVTPDHWLADSRTGAVLEVRIAAKAQMTVREPGGTTLRPAPPALRDRPVLDEAQVAALVELGRRVQGHCGTPQDIEWALAGGELCLLQARPITSLFPLPSPPAPPEAGLRVYVAGNLIQGIVEPLTPMGISLFHGLARGVARLGGLRLPPGPVPALKAAAGRLYVDAASALRHPQGRRIILGMTGMMEPGISRILRDLAERDPRLAPAGPRPVRPPLRLLLSLPLRALAALARPRAAVARTAAGMHAWIRAQADRAAGLQGIRRRVAFVREMAGTVFPVVVRFVPLMLVALGAWRLAERLAQRWLGSAAGLDPVLRSLPHNPTTEMDLALWQVSRALKAEGAAPAPDHPAVRAFLARYGHRGVREIDAGMPRWADDPEPVLAVLRTYLAHGDDADPGRQFQAGAAAAERAAADLVARVRRERGALRAAVLGFVLRRLRALAGVREYPKFFAVHGIALNRRVLLAAGRELAAAGQLDRPEDVFFLTLDELEAADAAAPAGPPEPAAGPTVPAAGPTAPAAGPAAPGLRALVAARRAEYEQELGRKAIPRVITSEGETFWAPPAGGAGQPAPAGALSGTSASPGVCEGRVRVVFDPRGARLEPGEVLVAPGTDPAWTPLFLSAGALVMEVGGMMSHGSVVAREYGIPAVVGVAGATERLHTGQRVRVDGEAGLVVPLD